MTYRLEAPQIRRSSAYALKSSGHVAGLVLAFSVFCCSAQAQLIDVNTLGNEAVPLTESMAAFLNTHDCITPAELAQFEASEKAMEGQLTADNDSLGSRKDLIPVGGNVYITSVTGGVSSRAVTRINNNRNLLRRHLKELRDLPACREPMPQWSGLYVGGGVGASRTAGNWQTTDVISLGSRDPLVDLLKSLAANDIAYWTYIGYGLYGSGAWEAAVEAEWAYLDALMDPGIPGTGAIGSAAVRANDSVTVRARWSAALRGRLGYKVTPSTQLYVATGPSWLRVDATVNCTTAGVCGTNGIPAFSQTNTDTLFGWTIGAGVETVLSGKWRGRAEYRYSDYQTFSTTFGTPARLSVASNIDLHVHAVMFGLTYAFGASR